LDEVFDDHVQRVPRPHIGGDPLQIETPEGHAPDAGPCVDERIGGGIDAVLKSVFEEEG
jgi:hypothetical protein